jgi:hypothetical protein
MNMMWQGYDQEEQPFKQRSTRITSPSRLVVKQTPAQIAYTKIMRTYDGQITLPEATYQGWKDQCEDHLENPNDQ